MFNFHSEISSSNKNPDFNCSNEKIHEIISFEINNNKKVEKIINNLYMYLSINNITFMHQQAEFLSWTKSVVFLKAQCFDHFLRVSHHLSRRLCNLESDVCQNNQQYSYQLLHSFQIDALAHFTICLNNPGEHQFERSSQ